MFNNMKNQVREKTGREVPKFTPQKGGLSRQSRQGSESSISSLVVDPIQPSTQASAAANTPAPDSHQIKLPDGRLMSTKEVCSLIKREEELKVKLEKKDGEWVKKIEKRESEIIQEWSEERDDWNKKEQELTEDFIKQTNELKDALRCVEEYKRKLCQYQEDKDQLEGFQMQEMAKIKHLLLAKERENADISASLKENSSLIESLKGEVNRLRPFEEQISNFEDDIEILRHTSEKERWQLSSKLAQSEEQVRHLTDRVAVLTRRSESDAGLNIAPDERVQALLGERTLLERRLEEAHVHLTDIKASWSAQISSLETQVGRLSRQAGEEGAERRRAESRITELESRLEDETREREKLSQRSERLSSERDSLASELKTVTSSLEPLRAENADLKQQLEKSETSRSEKIRECEEVKEETSVCQAKLSKLEKDLERLSADSETAKKRLEAEIARERSRVKELAEGLSKEQKEKDDALLRNAQVSQEVDIARQELRQQQVDMEDLYKKVSTLEATIQDKDQESSKCKSEIAELLSQVSTLQTEAESRQAVFEAEKNLKETIADLESQLADRNKNVKILQQRLSDMKKTLQRELKNAEPTGGNETVSNHHPANASRNNLDEDVNFLYLKHVIIKFLTSREYEAQQLTKAVATLLKLTAEEEGLLKDTLEWRMSWFGSRPRLPSSQLNS